MQRKIDPELMELANKSDAHNAGIENLEGLLTRSAGLSLISRDIEFCTRSIGGELLIHLTTHEEMKHIFTVSVANIPVEMDDEDQVHAEVPGGFIVSTEWLHTIEEMDKWLEECANPALLHRNCHWGAIDAMGDVNGERYHDYIITNEHGTAALELFRLLWAMKEWAHEAYADCIAGETDKHACTR